MLADVLDDLGQMAVDKLKAAVSRYSATGKTADSIRYESDENTLKVFGREYIEAMETGRGPRKSSEDGGFEDSMLEYMQAKGIGADLDEKKRRQLARFLVLRINRDGDKLHKRGGGRDVYSSVLDQVEQQIINTVTQFQINAAMGAVKNSLKDIK
jgi:hypothetical protein